MTGDYNGDGRGRNRRLAPGDRELDPAHPDSDWHSGFKVHLGRQGDVPIDGADFTGDGTDESPSGARLATSGSSAPRSRRVPGRVYPHLGEKGDTPVHADFTGDGIDDIAVWNPCDGEWSVFTSESDLRDGFVRFLGEKDAIPVPLITPATARPTWLSGTLPTAPGPCSPPNRTGRRNSPSQ